MQFMKKKEPKLRAIDRLVKPAITSLGFSEDILDAFLKKVYDEYEKRINLCEQIEGGIDRYESMGSIEALTIITMTQTARVIIMKNVYNDPCLPGDLELIIKGNLSNHVLTDPELKKDRKNLKLAIMMLVKFDDNEEAFTERERNYAWLLITLWRKSLEVMQMELYLSGKNPYPSDIKHVDLFLKILES